MRSRCTEPPARSACAGRCGRRRASCCSSDCSPPSAQYSRCAVSRLSTVSRRRASRSSRPPAATDRGWSRRRPAPPTPADPAVRFPSVSALSVDLQLVETSGPPVLRSGRVSRKQDHRHLEKNHRRPRNHRLIWGINLADKFGRVSKGHLFHMALPIPLVIRHR